MLSRRGFLGTVLALGAAPAIVRAGSLMPLWVQRHEWLVTPLWRPSEIKWGYDPYSLALFGRMDVGDKHWVVRTDADGIDDSVARKLIEAKLRGVTVVPA